MRDPRVFDFVDYVTFDDGERPLLGLLEHLIGKRDEAVLCRTFLRSRERVFSNGVARSIFDDQLGTPTYAGLALERYLSILDTVNPMHRSGRKAIGISSPWRTAATGNNARSAMSAELYQTL